MNEFQDRLLYLSDLNVGMKARIKKIDTPNPILKRRLLEMGITRGTEVEIKKVSPLGDPVDILIRGYELCLRKEDLKMIGVEVIQ
ncbi:MAG TPA: ferrous iron transport protein A [Acholeplasmataceae bacterium]|jgi:ferrous iron transport protein A|nr:ferrous iron transport protein A [Acholeplasmataceae bacterium]